MNLIDLDTFVRVAERGTLTAAAEALGIPKSTVSRRVTRLEDATGLPLLHRTGRGVSLTPEGERLFARTGPALADIAEAQRELEELDAEPRGPLRVTAPQDFGAGSRVAELLAAFLKSYPQVTLDITLTNRVLNLAEEGIDIALRPSGALAEQSHLTGRRVLSGFNSGLYATEAYLSSAPALTHPRQLAAHRSVAHPAFLSSGAWEGHRDGEDATPFELDVVAQVNDFTLLSELVLAGTGVGAMPQLLVERLVGAGQLRRVLPAWSGRGGSLWVVWPKSRHMTPKVRAFVDHVVEWAESGRLWSSDPAPV